MLKIGSVYKWLSAQGILSRKKEILDSFYRVSSTILTGDLFLLLDYDYNLNHIGPHVTRVYLLKILYNGQIWEKLIVVDINDDILDDLEEIC